MKFFQNTAFQNGTPGMREILVLPLDDILTFPTETSPAVAAGDTVKLTGPYVMKEGKFAINLKNDLLKGSMITIEPTGDDSAPGWDITVTGRQNGMTAAQIEQAKSFLGTPCVVLVKEEDCGTNEYKVVGCDCAPAYPRPSGTTGELGGSDPKGFNYSFKARGCLKVISVDSAARTSLLAPGAEE